MAFNQLNDKAYHFSRSIVLTEIYLSDYLFKMPAIVTLRWWLLPIGYGDWRWDWVGLIRDHSGDVNINHSEQFLGIFSLSLSVFCAFFLANIKVRKYLHNCCLGEQQPGKLTELFSIFDFFNFFGLRRQLRWMLELWIGSDRFHCRHQTRCHYAIQVTTRQIGVACARKWAGRQGNGDVDRGAAFSPRQDLSYILLCFLWWLSYGLAFDLDKCFQFSSHQ